MYNLQLDSLEQALATRSPKLANSLQPGISESQIQKFLKKDRIEGNTKPLVALYSWRNGTNPAAGLSGGQESIIPQNYYIFLELDMMLSHFSGLDECASYHSKLKPLVGRYFPIFWDGSNQYLSVDLQAPGDPRIVHVDMQAEEPVKEAYDSFEDFLNDTIRANQENVGLTCF